MAAITIIGGHGKVALRLAALLHEQGHKVTSWVRNPDHAAEVERRGATASVADVERLDTDAMAERLHGQDAAVWSAGAGGGSPERTYAVDRDAAIRSMSAAQQAGVRRYVMVSYVYDKPHHGVPEDNAFFPYADAKAAADEHLRGTRLSWTILGPGRLTLAEPTGSIAVGGQRVSGSEVSRANVAAVITEVAGRDDLAGRTIEFNDGDMPIPEALDAVAGNQTAD